MAGSVVIVQCVMPWVGGTSPPLENAARMKHLYTATFLFGLSPLTQAQLNNGSFEDSNGASLSGWEWTCDDPAPQMDAPFDGGIWSAWKQSGHTKGCFPNYLYQRVTSVVYGTPYHLSGWAKCPVGDVAFCIGATIGFGTINNGSFTWAEQATSTDPDWSFLTVDDTWSENLGDTAIVMLSAGLIGGPIDPLPAGFDNLMLSMFEQVPEFETPRVSLFPDPARDVLHIGGQERITGITLVDGTGRIVRTLSGGSSTVHLDVSALDNGTYVVMVTSATRTTAHRFVKED